MCENGLCEQRCNYGEAVECPILETIARFGLPQITESVQVAIPEIIRGNAQGTAENFFKTGWTGKIDR